MGQDATRMKRIFALALALLCGTCIASAQEQPVIHVALSPFEAQSNVYYAQDRLQVRCAAPSARRERHDLEVAHSLSGIACLVPQA